MTRRSPLTVQPKEIADLAAQILAYRKRDYEAAKARGVRNLDLLTHRVEVAKALVKLVEKSAPGRQASIFEQVKA